MSAARGPVICRQYLPVRLPLLPSAVLWLLLDRLAPPGWVWGFAGAFALLVWIVAVYAILTEDARMPVFRNREDS